MAASVRYPELSNLRVYLINFRVDILVVALRVLLGASEGCITSGLMTILTMFYTRVESTQRISWAFMCNGVASIIAAFISFGVAHTKATAHPHQ